MEMYKNWFANNIVIPLKGINDASERINFILDRKMDFVANNRNEEATMVVQMLDSLIEKEKFAIQINISSKREDKQSDKIRQEPEVTIDYSNNSDAEKIIFLHELGILEYLRNRQPFNTSINKLAEVISAFTGINQTTAQSYLNPMFSKGVDKSKSPLSAKNLKSVTEKLMKMGYIKNNNNPLQSA
jgi:hypothetical protein